MLTIKIIIFVLPIIITIFLIGIIIRFISFNSSTNFQEENKKELKAHFVLFWVFFFVLFVDLIFSIIYSTKYSTPLFSISNTFNSNTISNALDVFAIIVDVGIAIAESHVKVKLRFDYLVLSSISVDISGNHITATIEQKDDNSYYENTVVQFSKATVYLVNIRDVFADRHLFNELKDNDQFCKKIEIDELNNRCINISNIRGVAQFSFDIVDKDNLFSDILKPSISKYKDRQMIVFEGKYSFHRKSKIKDALFTKIYSWKTNKKDVEYTFFKFVPIKEDAYYFKSEACNLGDK